MYPKEWVFRSVEEAVKIVRESPYESQRYRSFVEEKRNVNLADKVAEIVCGGKHE
jgi:hypothetical protein